MSVVVNQEGRVRRIKLSRPHALNALNGDVYDQLDAQLTELQDQPEISVVVISGEGRAFSAGADLTGLGGGSNGGPLSWTKRRHLLGSWQRLLDLLERIPQVTVASLHGHCVGGAALLAISCDIRVASEDLKVRIPELAIGIPLTWAGVPRLAREVGLPLARDMVMTGRALDGEQALQSGFVQRLVPPDDLEAATDRLVGELLAMPPGPLAITRSMFSAINRERLGVAAWADADILGWSAAEPEAQEAAAAYLKVKQDDQRRLTGRSVVDS